MFNFTPLLNKSHTVPTVNWPQVDINTKAQKPHIPWVFEKSGGNK